MLKIRLSALALFAAGLLVAFFVYSSEVNPDSGHKFKLGLDLGGGSHLTYLADTSNVAENEIDGAMDSLRQTIERRINIFGVSEPIVQVEKSGIFNGAEGAAHRLIIELPGITDVGKAIELIGQTPLLEFKLLTEDQNVLDQVIAAEIDGEVSEELSDQLYVATGLTGSQLKRANVVFDQHSGRPLVSVSFNAEGKDLLADITGENIGKVMAIFLDGAPISTPVIQTKIVNGDAQITGDFTIEEARQLVQDLNFGALPLPVELIETQTIGATLGQETLTKGVDALIWGFGVVFIFLILFYRLPGIVATISLLAYLVIMLALFKLIPVTLTASGLAGFILSIGMAVDANVLIFERLREELRSGSTIYEAINESTKRAWSSIRDGNLSSLISAAVLFWMSGTSLVKGFALVFGIGVLASMFTAVFISKILLLALSNKKVDSKLSVLFSRK